MRLREVTICSAVGALLTLGLPLSGQTLTLKADIPFEFQVGQDTLPAGAYAITTAANQNVLIFSREDGTGNKPIMVLRIARESDYGAPSSLTFHRYGDRYFLATVKSGWRSVEFEAAPTRMEREIVKSARVPRQDYQILARR
jgi:hypothetical protein